jgi:hypothetical protein
MEICDPWFITTERVLLFPYSVMIPKDTVSPQKLPICAVRL